MTAARWKRGVGSWGSSGCRRRRDPRSNLSPEHGVDTNNDPQHCGGCGDRCDVVQICSDGNCRDSRPGVGCSTCPCDASCTGDFASCCPYPGRPSDVICVDGRCP